MPVEAVCNDLYFGFDVSKDLPELSIAEEMLIATVRLRSVILKLRVHATFKDPSTQQRYIHGHCISFRNSVGLVAGVLLPRAAHDLVDTIKVVFLGSSSSTINVSSIVRRLKVFKVRRAVVSLWLDFLIANNPQYKEIVKDEGCV